MTASEVRPSRRAQRRAETVTEIKDRAMRQIATDGVDGLSLNAVARSMSMAPAALYRYFASKDALLAELVIDAYNSLADHLDHALGDSSADPAGQFTAVAHAYRGWALAHAGAYQLVFQHSSGSGADLDPDRTLAAAQRSMDVILTTLAPLHPAGPELDDTLADQLTHWGQRSRLPHLPPATLATGLTTWSRLHGLISLELGHHLAATGIDPARLYTTEIQALLQPH